MNAKHLRELLEHGHHVQLTDEETLKKHTFVSFVDDIWFIGYKNNGSHAFTMSQGYIEADYLEDYKIVTPAPKLLEVGDEVEILENFRYSSKRMNHDAVSMIGKSGFTIKSVGVDGYIIDNINGNYRRFPHRAVAKLPPKEDETIKIIDGKTYKLVE